MHTLDKQKKELNLSLINSIIIIGGLVVSLIFSFITYNLITFRDKEATTRVIFDGLYDSVNTKLEYPAQVAQTMSCDTFLQELLAQEGTMDQDEFNQKMWNYLASIRDGNNWESAYLVSTKTLNYYTSDYSIKQINPAKDEYDLWYTNFLDTGIEYGADMTYDQYNDEVQTIFIDRRMEVDGELIAVLGCAIYLDDITELLASYSENYNIDVYFTDADGNVTLDKNGTNIGEAYVSRDYTNDMTSINTIFKNGDYVLRQYIPILGMYLVVENSEHVLASEFSGLLIANTAYLFLFLAIVLIFNIKIFKKEKNALRQQVITDYLTNILNRDGLQTSIKYLLDNPVSFQVGGSLFLIDIDNFKEVNDTLGHATGDEVLKTVAHKLSKIFRGGDIVGRLGGDEFMVFSPSLTEKDRVCEKATELSKKLRFTAENGNESVKITTSIGVAIYPTHGESYLELYRSADDALYEVKNKGKNSWNVHS